MWRLCKSLCRRRRLAYGRCLWESCCFRRGQLAASRTRTKVLYREDNYGHMVDVIVVVEDVETSRLCKLTTEDKTLGH